MTKVYYDRGSQEGFYKRFMPVEYLGRGLGLPHTELSGRVAGKIFNGCIWEANSSLTPMVWTEDDLYISDYFR